MSITAPTTRRAARPRGAGLPVVAAVAIAACGEGATGPSATDATFDVSAAFATLPEGYNTVPTSFAGAPSAGPWMAGGRGPGPGTGSLMGGGLGDAFGGAVAFGRHGGHGPFGGGAGCANGTFDAASGRVNCPAVTLPNGLTVTRSAAYATAAGQVQQAFDSATTDRVNLRAATTGTLTFDGTNGRGRGGFGFERRGGRGRRGPAAPAACSSATRRPSSRRRSPSPTRASARRAGCPTGARGGRSRPPRPAARRRPARPAAGSSPRRARPATPRAAS
jgi:hypothetical protein